MAGGGGGVAITGGPPRLSIVVLPFANITANPEQEYFVDGVTESLTTDLSRINGSLVIARNTAFTYKGKPIDVKQIGRELNVRYLLEGSVQRAGNRLRVNGQLIDAETGNRLWAERFDKPVTDLFEMQDEIVARLARALDAELTAAEARRSERLVNLDTMDLVFRAMAIVNHGINPASLARARELLEQALTLEPDNISALIGLGWVLCFAVGNYMSVDRASDLVSAERIASRLVTLAPNNAFGHAGLGFVYPSTNRVLEGIAECKHALSLDPNMTTAYSVIGRAYLILGQPQEVDDFIRQAIRLSPRDVYLPVWCNVAGTAKLFLGRDDEAIVWFQRAIESNRAYSLAYFYLAGVLAHQGKIDQATRYARDGLQHDPRFTIRQLFRSGPSGGNPRYVVHRERIYKGMLSAGLREQ